MVQGLSVVDLRSFSFSNNFFSNYESVSHTRLEHHKDHHRERGEDAAAKSISPRQTQEWEGVGGVSMRGPPFSPVPSTNQELR